MAHGAGGKIGFVSGDDDLAAALVERIKQRKLALVGRFLGDAVGNLNEGLFSVLFGKEIDLAAVFAENGQLVAAKEELVINDVFKVVRQVPAAAGLANGIEGHVLVVQLGIEAELTFGLGGPLRDARDDIGFFKV